MTDIGPAPSARAVDSGAEIRDAATVLLLRDGPVSGRPEVWMMTRVSEMVFAANASVFPGGRVEEADAELPWTGRPADYLAERFGCEAEAARRFVGAAVRETYEETGVLLTTPRAPSHLSPLARGEVEAGRRSFHSVLTEHALAIDADALHPWGRWVTPAAEGARRRYDARFFAAKLPPDAVAENLTTESIVAEWITPDAALAAAERGERMLMPPTQWSLMSLMEYATVDEILATSPERSLSPVRSKLSVDDEGQTWVTLPDGSRVRLAMGPERRSAP